MAEIELQFGLGREPIVRPGLRSLTLSADPASDDVPVIRVSAYVSTVEVEESSLKTRRQRGPIGVHSFHSEIEL